MRTQAWWMATLIGEGRSAEYRKERQRLLQRAKDTTYRNLARGAAFAAMLLPFESGDSRQQAMALADLGMAQSPSSMSRLTKGLALYRTDKFLEAMKALDLGTGGPKELSWYGIQAVAAMSHFKLGQQKEAVEVLRGISESDPSRLKEIEGSLGRDEAPIRVLLAEARALIKP